MKTYQPSPAFISSLKHRITLVMLVPAVFLIAVTSYAVATSFTKGIISGAYSTFLAVLFVALVVFPLRKVMRQLIENAGSYRLTVTDSAMTREQVGYPTVSITRGGIAKVIEDPSGALIVQATNRNTRFIIPALLDGFAEVRSRLAEWHPIEKAETRKLRLVVVIAVLLSLFFVAAWLVALITPNKYMGVGAGLVAWGGWVWYVVLVRRNPLVDHNMKRGVWMSVLPLLAMASKVILYLTPPSP